MSEFPLQAAKVQRPALRAETLHRDRLLDWLTAQADSKVILVTAEAGYGKTTLLADFSRRTRRRVLWYRIDENDRNWVSLVRYLVAAGQEVDSAFGAATRAALDQLGTADPSGRVALVAALVADYGAFASTGGAILILDDYHQVDDVAEIRDVLNDFVSHAPDGLTIVFAGRRTPSLAFAKLRSTGAVAELQTADLRFDLAESDRLFRETYGRNLDQDLLADVAHHTDGWAACLQLVQSALRNRSSAETREFITGLSGAAGDLHDYLAEEVVGDLEPAVQLFLMRTSLLQSVYPKLAAVIGEVDDLDAGRQVAETERIGLLSRRSDAHGGGRRYHPLVQEFLEARLRRDFGDAEIVRLHRLVAHFAEDTDWRLAAHHFAAAGDIDDLHRLVEASVPSIMAGGDFAVAESFIDRLPDGRSWPIFDIVLSRMELRRDRLPEAVRLAEAAVSAQRGSGPSVLLDQALANLGSVYHHAGLLEEAVVVCRELAEFGRSEYLVAIGRAIVQITEASVDGSIDDALQRFSEMAQTQWQGGDLHYFGISQLNIGEFERTNGNAEAALNAADQAVAALTASSAGHEIPAARLIRAWANAHLGRPAEALAELDSGTSGAFAIVGDETRVEAASILATYFDARRAREILAGVGPTSDMPRDLYDQYLVALSDIDISDGLTRRAIERLTSIDVDRPHRESGFKAHVLTTRAFAAVLLADPVAEETVIAAIAQASEQGAGRWLAQAKLLLAALRGTAGLEAILQATGPSSGPWMSVLAELFMCDLVKQSPLIDALIDRQVRERPGRWLMGLRRALSSGNRDSQERAAALLDTHGEPPDVVALRAFARKGGKLKEVNVAGRGLARRVADRVSIEDLGRVRISIGPRVVEGDAVRRKVSALLCLLVTRPNMAAARDQVVDALWPDQDPGAASNSLNQTVYFLRRVFEPSYVEDTSPGYLHHESDLIWLDSELVTAESTACKHAIEVARRSSAWSDIDRVSRTYRGRFALDFEYEDWSTDYRENLHSSYLEVVERAIDDETNAARFDRAIELSRRALDVDPSCEQIERRLLRLYRITGAHAAAEQQYQHYAIQLREDLGISAPPLSEI
ncbi:MAG TPA: BTAD domain-containing putative transcriptional regulator [Candidatus Limnocylindrales bacterium]|nr:BTAD domain-containing putative transcriptional regulator [Candidatus Limnocylindrales bacterium]